MPSDWLVCSAVAKDIARLGPVLSRAVGDSDPRLAELAGHLLALGGKRLRPALLLLARGDEPADETALSAAAAVELIHVASLYHDDIMDRSVIRRGAHSASARWGNGAATMAGTFLFARAQKLLRSVGHTAVERSASAAARLCTGQLREAENAFNLDLDIDEHLQILDEKTATLFMLAAELGAHLGGRSGEETAGLASYAASLGLAFQLFDDLLDWTGAAARLGKATGTDVRGGIYNLPLLTALAVGGGDGGALRLILMKREISDDDLARATAIVTVTGIGPVRRRAEQLAGKAVAALAPIEKGPVRASLAALAHLAVRREA